MLLRKYINLHLCKYLNKLSVKALFVWIKSYIYFQKKKKNGKKKKKAIKKGGMQTEQKETE